MELDATNEVLIFIPIVSNTGKQTHATLPCQPKNENIHFISLLRRVEHILDKWAYPSRIGFKISLCSVNETSHVLGLLSGCLNK